METTGAFGDRVKGFAKDVGAGVRRFPLPLAAGLAGAIAGIAFIEQQRRFDNDNHVLALLLTCWLGVALFLGAALAGERGARGVPGRVAWSLAVAGVLAACYASLRGHRDDWTLIRFALWLVAAHALLALVPLAGRRPRGDFRAFNLMLFARTALALLMTGVLQAGLSFALLALQHLFDLHVPGERHPQLWFALMGVFNTAYVLAGIPRDWDTLEGRFPTPRPLDLLARHILLPLSVLYLVILYVYSVKILVAHEWPRGWVSAPVIVFAAVGLLTVLLLEPGRSTGSKVVRAYCRGFFVALLPLVVLLFLAISRRTTEYGLTEERCIVYAIAAFLAIVASYFVLSKTRNLAVIPFALAAIALLTGAGPLSARSLSVRSQTARVRALLVQHHRLEHGVLVRAAANASAKDEHELSAALGYLERCHELGGVVAWRAPDGASCGAVPCATFTKTADAGEIVRAVGLTYRPGSERADNTSTISGRVPAGIPTAGFDWVIPGLSCYEVNDCARGEGSSPDWRLHLDGGALAVEREGRALGKIALAGLEARARDDGKRDVEEPIVQEGTWDGGRYRLYVSSVTVEHEGADGKAAVSGLHGVLLLSLTR